MTMTEPEEGVLLKKFAKRHRLKLRLDEDNTHIIPGRAGHIYEYGNHLLGVMVMSDSALTAKWWSNRKRSLLAAGCTVVQDGDREGAVTFDPDNPEQIRTALRAARAKKIRQRSPEATKASSEQMKAINRMRWSSPKKAST